MMNEEIVTGPWGPRSRPVAHCDYCGSLEWTRREYDRLTHKHNCPHRTKRYCQTHGMCDLPEVQP